MIESRASLINDIFTSKNINESMINDRRSFTFKKRKTEYIADRLCSIFEASNCRMFFLKAAWRLPEGYIWSIAELAKNKKNPVKYFNRCCKNELNKKQ